VSTPTTTPTRTVGGVELPTTGTWDIDPGHAEVAFIGRHFMLTRIRGRFTGVTGAVTIAEQPADSTVEVVIDMASVSSGDQSRDDHLRSPDFFDVEAHPTATFRSKAIRWSGTRGLLDGELTIKGITRPVVLEVDYAGFAHDPFGNDKAVFSARGRIDREAWGLTWNMVLDAGGLLVSKQIDLEVEVETVRRAS
jgi:polyisoprenoid-binding protein YceI